MSPNPIIATSCGAPETRHQKPRGTVVASSPPGLSGAVLTRDDRAGSSEARRVHDAYTRTSVQAGFGSVWGVRGGRRPGGSERRTFCSGLVWRLIAGSCVQVRGGRRRSEKVRGGERRSKNGVLWRDLGDLGRCHTCIKSGICSVRVRAHVPSALTSAVASPALATATITLVPLKMSGETNTCVRGRSEVVRGGKRRQEEAGGGQRTPEEARGGQRRSEEVRGGQRRQEEVCVRGDEYHEDVVCEHHTEEEGGKLERRQAEGAHKDDTNGNLRERRVEATGR